MKLRIAIQTLFIVLIVSLALASLMLSAFYMGRLAGALNPSWTAEKAMCVSQEVDLRESPTGYVIGNIPAGEMLWFIKLDLPFAHVAFFDGSTWLEGTVPAFVLEVCGQ